jgi:hypothetical protein
LKFLFQPFLQRGQLLLPLRFDFLPQGMLDPAPLLQIALFKLRALFAFKVQTGFPERRIYFLADLSTVNLLAHPHYLPFLGTHLHPALGISLEDLSILWGHCKKTLPRIIERRSSAGLR